MPINVLQPSLGTSQQQGLMILQTRYSRAWWFYKRTRYRVSQLSEIRSVNQINKSEVILLGNFSNQTKFICARTLSQICQEHESTTEIWGQNPWWFGCPRWVMNKDDHNELSLNLSSIIKRYTLTTLYLFSEKS